MAAIPVTAIPIAVISFGHEQPHARNVHDLFTSDSTWKRLDLRHALTKDPSTTIGHGENGTFDQTQKTVIAQDGFPKLMKDLVELADRGISGFLLGCRTGCHRADTSARFFTSILNYIETSDGRCFNAQHFALSSAYGRVGVENAIREAIDWRDSPWSLVDGGRVEWCKLYGYTACMTTRKSAENFNEVMSHIDYTYAEPNPPGPVRSKRKCDSEPIIPPPRPPLPDWASFERDPHVWVSFLGHAGVDTHAQQDLFCLAQMSDAGYEEANHIISKVLKKMQDGEDLRKPSAFVHTAVQSARHRCTVYGWKPSSSSAWSGGGWQS